MNRVLFAFMLLPLGLFAQKHDYIWVSGDSNNPNDTTKGGSVIDFHYTPPKVYYNYRTQNFRACNASICDTAGNLMLYTNGCAIAGADDEIVENGEGINPGGVSQTWCNQYSYYPSGYQSAIILPLPQSTVEYFLFHKRPVILNNPFDIKIDKLFYSRIDMSENDGKGKVVAKNVEIMSDDIAYGELTAVKHANGKDWWLVTPKRNSNTFYSFLFTKDGIVDTLVQSIGDPPRTQAEGGIQVCFSPDGTKLFRTNPQRAVKMYGYDRESGLFTSYDTISVNYHNYPNPVTAWCAVSPNNRFLYVTTSLYVFQYDLWASDISGSQKIVAEWDGFKDPVGTTFGTCQLGPDCKIYIVTIDSRYYHVINDPDEEGVACNVTQHSFIFPTPTGASIPSFPNYRLGPLDNPGVPCTATVNVNNSLPATEKNTVQVWPNPATDEFTLSYSLPQARGESRLILTDLYGRVVHETRLQGASGRVAVRTEGWATGVYFFSIASNEVGLSSGKIIVQR